MAYRPTLQEFLLNRTLVALRLPPEELPGRFRRRLTVPAHTAALARTGDGWTHYLAGGQEVFDRCELVIAKDGEVELKMIFPDLKTRDGYAVTATCGLVVRVLIDRPDLFKDFVRSAMTDQLSCSTSDLKTLLGRELKRILGEFSARFTAAELNRRGPFDDFAERFDTAVERFVFGTGLRYERLSDVAFASHEFEQARQQDDRRQAEARASEDRLRLKEERLRRLAGLLENETVQGLLARVPDERARAVLYAKIMEEDAVDLTAPDLAARLGRDGGEVVDLLQRTLADLTGTAPALSPEAVAEERASAIYLAVGARVIALDPGRPSETRRTYAFPAALRSVRTAATPYGEALLGGGKTSVMLTAVAPAGDGPPGALLEFPLPPVDRPRGGFNAMAVFGRWLLATHSEFGLAVWDLNRPGEPAQRLLPALTDRARTTRAVTPTPSGALFASGPDLYALTIPPDASSADALERAIVHTRFSTGADSPVTCAAVTDRFIYAGTAAGALVCWKRGEPGSLQVLARRKDPIASVRVAAINKIPHLLYSSHDLSVHARVIGQSLETQYDSDGSSAATLAASSDLLAALDSSGMRLMLWKTSQPGRPSDSLDCWTFAQKPVLDLWVGTQPVDPVV